MRRLLRKFFDFRRDELPVVLLLFSFFFLAVAVFQILKPLKNGLFIEHYGAQIELYAKLGNIVVAGLAVTFFTALYNRLRRDRMIYVICGLFAAALLAYTVLLQEPTAASIWSFYWLGDLVSTLVIVSAFWAYATDLADSDQAKRLFGAVGGGGVLGGWMGIAYASTLLEVIGMENLLVSSAAIMGVIMLVVFLTERQVARSRSFGRKPAEEDPDETDAAPSAEQASAALEGARLVMRSPYLLAIVGILGFYEIASQVMDYQFKSLTEALAGVTATQAFMADVYFYANLLSVIVQLFLVSYIMRRFGLTVTLLVLPVALMASSLAFLALPTLLVSSFLVISDNGLNYSIQQTGRESLYVVTTADEKYKARAFTNMFVQRVAKGIAILLALFLAVVGIAPRWMSLITVAVVAGMIVCSVVAGRRFRQRARQAEGPDSDAAELAVEPA